MNKIEINKTDGDTGAISIEDIGTSSTYGAGTSGTTTDAVYLGNVNTTSVTLTGTQYNFNNSVYIQAAAADENIVISSGGSNAVAITSSGGNIGFATSGVILQNNAATSIATAGGAVSFGANTLGTSGSVSVGSIDATAGITAGTPTTLTNTITSALRGQALTGTDFVIPAASDSNGTIASYALNTAFSASTGLSSDANWLSFNPSNRQITGNVPASYIAGGGSITVPIRITDNAGNILDQDYTITVDGQGFSYPLGISHSAMFDGSSSLSRSPSTIINSSQTTWTWSMWMKRSKLGIGNMRIFGVATGSTQTEINAVSYTHLTLPTNREV